MARDFNYDEFPDEDLPDAEQHKVKQYIKNKKKDLKDRNILREMGEYPPLTDDLIEERLELRKDYIKTHELMFKTTSGLKPLGVVQKESLSRLQETMQEGGKIVLAEPRGYGKTTRGANSVIKAVLDGDIRFALILGSSKQKATDIFEGIVTELAENDEIERLHPGISHAVRHYIDWGLRRNTQLYNNEPTGMEKSADKLILPSLPGEPGSGGIIMVRSKDNLRGVFHKNKQGTEKTSNQRPDFCLLDDIQTDKEARSPTTVDNIVNTIKRSILFGGSHFKKMSAAMLCTPIAMGDVSSHYILHEPSWEVVLYKMLTKMPTNMHMWINDYKNIYHNFDKYKQGDKKRAEVRARQYVLENYEKLHLGCEWTWDWAYEWQRDFEVSPVHHAMNIFLDEGETAFNLECQCIIQLPTQEIDGVKASRSQMEKKVHNLPRKIIPVESKHLVTQIDVNMEILTAVTMTSPDVLIPHVIDYQTWPPQPTDLWKKGSLHNPLTRMYPHIPELELRLYQAVKDFTEYLGEKSYMREDGVEIEHHLIGCDINYMKDEVVRAIRDSQFRSMLIGTQGLKVKKEEKPFDERPLSPQISRHKFCYTDVEVDRAFFKLVMDVNSLKTLIHKGFKARMGMPSSLSIFTHGELESPFLFHSHCLAESPHIEYNEKEDRTLVAWDHTASDDNEYFDNSVGCLALLFKRGCVIENTAPVYVKQNVQEFFDSQKDIIF